MKKLILATLITFSFATSMAQNLPSTELQYRTEMASLGFDLISVNFSDFYAAVKLTENVNTNSACYFAGAKVNQFRSAIQPYTYAFGDVTSAPQEAQEAMVEGKRKLLILWTRVLQLENACFLDELTPAKLNSVMDDVADALIGFQVWANFKEEYAETVNLNEIKQTWIDNLIQEQKTVTPN